MSKKCQIVLITGATTGLGRHAALHLAERGHHVIATGRRAGALSALRSLATGRLDTLLLDVTDAASIAAARTRVDELTDGYGVDVLVNNAGYGQLGPLEMVSDADLRAQFETNVFGLMAVTRAFLPAMRERGRGRILNVSSMGGRVTFPMSGAYHASKYAVEAMSDALRNELAPFGVDVVLIEPGAIRSEFTDRAMDGLEPYRIADSPYAPLLADADEVRDQTDRLAGHPGDVSRGIEAAMTARRPRARYVMPLHPRVLLLVARLLPTRWMDALMRRLMGLSRRRLQALPAPT